jgi:hypothetical protein
MGLTIRRQDEEPEESERFSWSKWYRDNKERLSEKKAHRYQTDEAYRNAAIARSRARRKTPVTEITDGHTVSFSGAAKELGLTPRKLHAWRKQNLFPEPFQRDNRLWFTPDQVNQLKKLQAFFDAHGDTLTDVKKSALEDVTNLIYANW